MTPTSQDELQDLIAADDRDGLARVLDREPDLVSRPLAPGKDPWAVDGWTPLHLAAWRGRLQVAALLLERGAPIDAVDSGGRTPLHHAIEAGGPAISELLVERGARVDVCAAAILGHHDRLRDLLAEDPSQADDLSTDLHPLGWAAFGDQPDSARLLLEHGAAGDRHADDALFCAVSVDAVGFLRFMLDRGGDPNATRRGRSLLHEAVAMRYSRDSRRVVALLLERGADPSARDGAGRTPLELAREGAEQEDGHPAAPSRSQKRYETILTLLEQASSTGA